MAHRRRPTIALLAPQGFSLKNWLLSDLPDELEGVAELIFFTPEAERLERKYGRDGLSFEPLRVEPLGRVRTFVAGVFVYAHFYRQRTFIHRYMIGRAGALPGLKARLMARARNVLARVVALLPTSFVERGERALLGLGPERARLRQVFDGRGVDVVFSTMPLIAHYERPALWAAGDLGIAKACIITSWDNLYSKGRLPVQFDRYLVWSELMANELMSHYPYIERDRVRVTGPPQFDFYRKPELLLDREAFIRSLEGDPDRPLILWSGASMNQMPGEAAILEGFCEAVREGRVPGDPQILFRPHPIGGGERVRRVLDQFPELLFTESNSRDPRLLIHWTPDHQDISLLVNSIAHAAVNINHCSTMTLDCAALDRPVVNIAFGPEADSSAANYIRLTYEYDHYRTVIDAGAVRLAHDMEELIAHVAGYLEDPARDRTGRKRLLDLQCGELDGGAARRAADALLTLAGGGVETAGAERS